MKLRAAICLIIALLFLSAPIIAEEPQRDKAAIRDAYDALPDNPSGEKADRFYALLLSTAWLKLHENAPRGGLAETFRYFGINSFDDDYIFMNFDRNVKRKMEKAELIRTGKLFKILPHKATLFSLMRTRLVLEGRSETPSPDNYIEKRMLLAHRRISAGTRPIGRTIRGSHPMFEKKREFLRTGLRAIDREFSVSAWYEGYL